MMKYLMVVVLLFTINGCASYVVKDDGKQNEMVDPVKAQALIGSELNCLGEIVLPTEWENKLVSIDDAALLEAALGQPNQGKLCQGQVFRVTDNATIYRAWNSTNPNSEMGSWWAFEIPQGRVSQYRSDYEICYQWSPLDKLTQCELSAGTKIVIGTGQSATCSEYLAYPVSSVMQIYIETVADSVTDCARYDGEFSWRPVVSH